VNFSIIHVMVLRSKLVMSSDSKCGFGRDREKSLKCGSRVPYRAENAVRPTQKPFRCGCFVADRPHFESLVMSYLLVFTDFFIFIFLGGYDKLTITS